jgi:hypothetical protein
MASNRQPHRRWPPRGADAAAAATGRRVLGPHRPSGTWPTARNPRPSPRWAPRRRMRRRPQRHVGFLDRRRPSGFLPHGQAAHSHARAGRPRRMRRQPQGAPGPRPASTAVSGRRPRRHGLAGCDDLAGRPARRLLRPRPASGPSTGLDVRCVAVWPAAPPPRPRRVPRPRRMPRQQLAPIVAPSLHGGRANPRALGGLGGLGWRRAPGECLERGGCRGLR